MYLMKSGVFGRVLLCLCVWCVWGFPCLFLGIPSLPRFMCDEVTQVCILAVDVNLCVCDFEEPLGMLLVSGAGWVGGTEPSGLWCCPPFCVAVCSGWGVLGQEWEQIPQLPLEKIAIACLVSNLTQLLSAEEIVLLNSK